MLFFEYIIIFKYLICCVIIAFLLVSISFLLVFQDLNSEKLSIYECGFNPFADSRIKFEVKFYLVGILFVIFDLELVFLLPWVAVCYKLSYLGFFTIIFFLLILTLGFIYEWLKGALDWF